MTTHRLHDVDDWRPQVRLEVHGNSYKVTREDRRHGDEVIAQHGNWTRPADTPNTIDNPAPTPELVNYTDYVVACPWPHKGESCGWCSI